MLDPGIPSETFCLAVSAADASQVPWPPVEFDVRRKTTNRRLFTNSTTFGKDKLSRILMTNQKLMHRLIVKILMTPFIFQSWDEKLISGHYQPKISYNPESLGANYSRLPRTMPYATVAMTPVRLTNVEMPWSFPNFLFNRIISFECGGGS